MQWVLSPLRVRQVDDCKTIDVSATARRSWRCCWRMTTALTPFRSSVPMWRYSSSVLRKRLTDGPSVSIL